MHSNKFTTLRSCLDLSCSSHPWLCCRHCFYSGAICLAIFFSGSRKCPSWFFVLPPALWWPCLWECNFNATKLLKLANQHISNFTGCAELTTTTCPWCLSYVYLRPSIYNFSATITPILEAIAAPFTIIDTDANAKFQLWNSMLSDKRGWEFEPMLAYFIFNVVNRSKTELDFSPSGTGFVDLTLVGDKVRVHRWLYLATPSISDHPYIFFEIDHVHFAKSQMKPNCWLAPNLIRVNRDLFFRKLFYALSHLPTPVEADWVSWSTYYASCICDLIDRGGSQNHSTLWFGKKGMAG